MFLIERRSHSPMCQTTPMGFNQTAVKPAVEGIGSGGGDTPGAPDRPDLVPEDVAGHCSEQFSRQPRAVLCGSFRMGIPSLVRAYRELSAAGIRVLSPSGLDFVAQIDGHVLNQDGVGIPPEASEELRLDCIRDADLVWLDAPGGHVDLTGALEIGFANAAGVPVYAEAMPRDPALRSLVTVSPLDQAIAATKSGGKDQPGASPLPRQEYSAAARRRGNGHNSEHDIMLLITEEIGELARRNPGQRQRLSEASTVPPARGAQVRQGRTHPIFGRLGG